MDPYGFDRDVKESAEYEDVPFLLQVWKFIVLVTFPVWIIPWLLVRRFRH
jgi:hypothetical protein